jgi:hypothetical protein
MTEYNGIIRRIERTTGQEERRKQNRTEQETREEQRREHNRKEGSVEVSIGLPDSTSQSMAERGAVSTSTN